MQTTTSNPRLQVITHNGKLPSEGGLRLGYRGWDTQSETWWMTWLTPPILPPGPPKPPLPHYGAFPTTKWGECPACGAFIVRLRSDVQVKTSDCGLVSLHQCACGQLIRP